MRYYIWYFFIYAIIGWILEVSFHVITQGKFINRGFLNGPYCPIYGIGSIAVVFLLGKLGDDNKLFIFFMSMIVASLLELVTGFLLEKIFHKRWWDYRNNRFNLGGYICAEFSLVWGAVCFILYESIHPMIRKAAVAIPVKVLISTNIIMGLIFIIDLTATIITLVGLSSKFKIIERQSQDIRKVSDEIGQKVADRTFDAIEKKKRLENSKLAKEFDERSVEFKEFFDKVGEKRILRSYPNLLENLEDKWDNRQYFKDKNQNIKKLD